MSCVIGWGELMPTLPEFSQIQRSQIKLYYQNNHNFRNVNQPFASMLSSSSHASYCWRKSLKSSCRLTVAPGQSMACSVFNSSPLKLEKWYRVIAVLRLFSLFPEYFRWRTFYSGSSKKLSWVKCFAILPCSFLLIIINLSSTYWCFFPSIRWLTKTLLRSAAAAAPASLVTYYSHCVP